jgi:regulatory protein
MRLRLSLKARALQLLAQREHSRLELRRKLLDHANLEEAPGRPKPPCSPSGAPTPLGDGLGGAQQAAGTLKPDAAAEPAAPPMFARRVPPTPEMQADVDALLDWLAEQGHLSEARFVEARVRTRAARLGNLRIRQELARHGLQLDPDAEQALRDNEFARARQVWARKFDIPADDAAGRARQQRFLAGRGFSADVIRRLLRGDEDD